MKKCLTYFIIISYLFYSLDLFAQNKACRNNRNTQIISTYPYIESFEGTQAWVSGGINSSWELGTPNGVFFNSASNGQNAWVTNLDSAYNQWERSWVESPFFDFSNLTAPVIKFDISFDCFDFEDGACFEYSVDGGANWFHLGQYGDPGNWYNTNWVTGLYYTNSMHGWTGNVYPAWHQSEHDLGLLAGEDSVKFRFYFGSTENFTALEGFGFDNILIYDVQPYDIAISSLLYPTGTCILSNSESIIVELTNYGYNQAAGFNLSYSLNNSALITEFIPDTILPDSSFIYIFNAIEDLSQAGSYTFFLEVDLQGDQAVYNDTITIVVNLAESLSLPYTEDFEGGVLPAGWTLKQEAGSDGWLVGNNLGSTYFPVPSHTFYAASNDDTCYCDMSNDMLITPAFDFSQFAGITLQFDAFISGQYGSSGKVLASTDCGYSWDLVSYVAGNPQSWQSISFDLSAYSGFASVLIAFHHNDNGGWSAGFAIDDIQITGTPFSETQAIYLHQGWGMVSSYINPEEPLIDSLFSDVSNNLTILKDGNGMVYWPLYNLNIIGTHTIGEGYQYLMTQGDTLFVTGTLVFPQYTIVDIPIGWSILGYLRHVTASIELMMLPVVANISIMKDEDGNVYWPEYNVNMIVDMQPGKAYQIKLNNPVSFSYPANP